jgi:salicylate hydroxylase
VQERGRVREAAAGEAAETWWAAVDATRSKRGRILDTKPFLIVGGGLGGLAAALALARVGRRSIVLEQAPQFGEIGAGIQIAPNAFNVFDCLGVGDLARKGAVFIDELVLMDAVGGERIASIPLGEACRRRFGNPYAVVHRADLHTVLLEACRAMPNIDLRVSSRVVGYRQSGDGVSVTLDNKDVIEGCALVGADGLWSVIRRQMLNDDPPRVSGHTTFRSVIPTEQMPEDLRWNAATLWAGPNYHLVHYPLKGWQVFNLVITAHTGAKEPAASVPIGKEDVRRWFRNVHPRAAQIIDYGQDWKYWVLCDREPTTNWQDGRAVLLGDAAHPMLQYFAQGACMAMEDAVCLALMVERHGDELERAFADYNRIRMPRTGRVQFGSRLLGEYVYHPSGGRALVRNATMQAKSAEDWFDELEWLYGSIGVDRADLAGSALATGAKAAAG